VKPEVVGFIIIRAKVELRKSPIFIKLMARGFIIRLVDFLKRRVSFFIGNTHKISTKYHNNFLKSRASILKTPTFHRIKK
jgi:hypothetical protein